jgi:UDP-glucose 4-epimerase
LNSILDVSLVDVSIELLNTASSQHEGRWNHTGAIVDSPFDERIDVASFGFAAARCRKLARTRAPRRSRSHEASEFAPCRLHESLNCKMTEMPKILVTGGAGYIGSITTFYLLRRGFEVVVIDDLSRGHRDNVDPARLHEFRLQDTLAVEEILTGVHAVVHFAAFIAVGESVREPELYYENNIGGTLSLLKAMGRAGVDKLVFSSTAAVYGNPERVPIPEDARIDPINPYGESKAIVEKILRSLDRYRGLRSVALRYFNACGGEPDAGLGERHDPETHLIPLLLKAAKTGTPMQIFGNDYPTPDGTCTRDYIHVSDLAAAHVAALDHLLKGGASDAFNVGTGHGQTVMEVLRAAETITGMKVPFQVVPRRDGDPAELVADAAKLRRTLGWKPERSDLDAILRDAWKFFQKQAH